MITVGSRGIEGRFSGQPLFPHSLVVFGLWNVSPANLEMFHKKKKNWKKTVLEMSFLNSSLNVLTKYTVKYPVTSIGTEQNAMYYVFLQRNRLQCLKNDQEERGGVHKHFSYTITVFSLLCGSIINRVTTASGSSIKLHHSVMSRHAISSNTQDTTAPLSFSHRCGHDSTYRVTGYFCKPENLGQITLHNLM